MVPQKLYGEARKCPRTSNVSTFCLGFVQLSLRTKASADSSGMRCEQNKQGCKCINSKGVLAFAGASLVDLFLTCSHPKYLQHTLHTFRNLKNLEFQLGRASVEYFYYI